MKRILVADDSVTIQKVIALTFADEPFEVQSVGTGAEALELVKSWKPDIVLADVIMPQMNGYELCRAVKQQGDMSSIPVLLLAGTFEAFDEEEARSVGADDFITKPFESVELIGKVKSLIGDVPTAPPATEVAPQEEVQVTPELVIEPEEMSPPEGTAHVPPQVVDTSEPDIWDILSDAEGDSHDRTTADSEPGPGFSPVESSGVIDVGAFDVGIGRQDIPASPSQAPAPSPIEPASMPEVEPEPPAPQIHRPEEAPAAFEPIQSAEEKSRVENMEKDFFGFEIGAVEEIAETDYLEDDVEEVTFEVEQVAEFPEPVGHDAPLTVSEPEGDQVAAPVETVPPGVAVAESAQNVQTFPEPVPGFFEEPVVSQPEDLIGESAPDAEPGSAGGLDIQPSPEPPLELSVDFTSDLPEPFTPAPVAEPLDAPFDLPEPFTPAPATEPLGAPSFESSVTSPLDVSTDLVEQETEVVEQGPEPAAAAPDDAAIRKIIEEKVEKIAWEVIPEMAEVIIREAIQKIKDGS